MSDSNNGGAAAGVAEAAAVVSPPDTVQGSSVLTHLPVSTTQVLLVLAPAVMLSAAFRLGDLAECLLGSLSGSGSGSSASGRMSFVRTLVDACTRLAFVLAAAFAAEYAPVYEHEAKAPSLDMFWFCCILALGAAWAFTRQSVRRLPATLLSRDLTEEWKGGMQIAILLYHYFKVGAVYNAVRVFITSYVWLTGFGHTMYFSPPSSDVADGAKRASSAGARGALAAQPTSQVTVVRLLQSLWRLNFLAIVLALTVNNAFILYYIPSLHTLQFVLVFALMAVGPAHWSKSRSALRWRIAAGGVILFLLYDLPIPYSGFGFALAWLYSPDKAMCGIAGDVPCPVGGGGAQWEWYFRTHLDHWVIFLGMVFAFHYQRLCRWFHHLDSMRNGLLVRWLVAAAALGLFAYWWIVFHALPKFEYNALHPYAGWIPVVAYVVLRNLWPCARSKFLGLLRQVGKITLELYLLQHHLWLGSHAKTLVVIVPGMPMVNFALVSIGFVVAAHQAFGASMTLRALLFPDNTSACIASTIVLAAVWILTKFAAEHLATVAPDAPGAGAVESMALAERVLVGAVSLSEVLALVCVLAGAAGVAAHIWMQQPSGASRVFRGGVAALCLGVVSSVAGLLLFRLPAGQLGVRAGRAVDVTAATTMAETIEPAELLTWSIVDRMQTKQVGCLADTTSGLLVLLGGTVVLFLGK